MLLTYIVFIVFVWHLCMTTIVTVLYRRVIHLLFHCWQWKIAIFIHLDSAKYLTFTYCQLSALCSVSLTNSVALWSTRLKSQICNGCWRLSVVRPSVQIQNKMQILICPCVRLWRQTTAVVNRADHRLTAGVANCCKGNATLRTYCSQSLSIAESNRKWASFYSQCDILVLTTIYMVYCYIQWVTWLCVISAVNMHALNWWSVVLLKTRSLVFAADFYVINKK